MKTVAYTSLKKWLSKGILTLTAIALIATTVSAPAYAQVARFPSTQVEISSNAASPDTINSLSNETMTIDYCLNTKAQTTVAIFKAEGDNVLTVATLTNAYTQDEGCYSKTWDGRSGAGSQIGAYGDTVPNGKYFYGIHADGVSPISDGSSYKAEWVYVNNVSAGEQLRIIDTEVKNSTFDPWDNQEADISFYLNKGSYVTVEIFEEDDDDDVVKSLADEKWYDKGEHSVDWDGTDEWGDIVDEDEYEYVITAELYDEEDEEDGALRVKKGYDVGETTKEPRLKYVYSTKDSFDPGRNEYIYIVFDLMAEADLVVKMYDEAGEEVEELLDSDDVSAGTYKVKWDGEVAIGTEEEYTYKIFAQNSKGEYTVSGEIMVEEDYKNDNKPNIYKDRTDKIPYKPGSGNLNFSFKLDKDAEVTLEIRDEGDTVAEIVEEVSLSEGSHNLSWNGKDLYGDYLDNGVYEYKLIAQNIKGKDVEKGNISIEDTSKTKNPFNNCGGYSDVKDSNKYCDAIDWATDQGIFTGYNDGTFKPNNPINRVEALKVIIEAMNIKTISSSGSSLGFKDVNVYEWYMKYLETAMSLGIVNGYSNGTFKPGNYVLRVEALKIMLEAGKAKYGIVIPTHSYGEPYLDTPNNAGSKWYLSYAWFAKENDLIDSDSYFHPGQPMTRGQMADMLYRYHQADLDQ